MRRASDGCREVYRTTLRTNAGRERIGDNFAARRQIERRQLAAVVPARFYRQSVELVRPRRRAESTGMAETTGWTRCSDQSHCQRCAPAHRELHCARRKGSRGETQSARSRGSSRPNTFKTWCTPFAPGSTQRPSVPITAARASSRFGSSSFDQALRLTRRSTVASSRSWTATRNLGAPILAAMTPCLPILARPLLSILTPAMSLAMRGLNPQMFIGGGVLQCRLDSSRLARRRRW